MIKWLFGLLILTLFSCQEETKSNSYQAEPSQVGNQKIKLLTLAQPQSEFMEALMSGVLTVDSHGCMKISEYTIIWPHGFRIGDNNLSIYNEKSEVVAKMGDQVQLSGGACSNCPENHIKELIGFAPDSKCLGNYWIVGEDIRTIDASKKDTRKRKHVEKNSSSNNEKLRLLESTKNIIERNEGIPTFTVDTLGDKYKPALHSYEELDCLKDQYSKLTSFNNTLIQEFHNSSSITNKYDGARFCLRKLDLPEDELSLIVYGRNEGGHTSDQIEVVLFNQEARTMNILPLHYQTGWDGHQTIVESTIKEMKITRKVTERYGWSDSHPDSLAKQPRREVSQVFNLKGNGTIEKESEKVMKYNIDELFD